VFYVYVNSCSSPINDEGIIVFETEDMDEAEERARALYGLRVSDRDRYPKFYDNTILRKDKNGTFKDVKKIFSANKS
jgi:hypothetical protein